MSVVLTDGETGGGGDSIQKNVGALEANVENLEEKVEDAIEETEEKVEAVEEKIEQLEAQAEWNNQEKTSIWTSIQQNQSDISELKSTATTILEMLKEEADDADADDQESQVADDLPTIEAETPNEEATQATANPSNLLHKILFGR